VLVEGLGVRYAEDIGGAIQENRIDIYMDDHATALSFGVKELEIQLLEQ
jgi:3D (Asp-Asp-Asp) domain-containing protein